MRADLETLRNVMYSEGGRYRKTYFVNAALGSDGNDGLSHTEPIKKLRTAYDKLESLKGDRIVLQQSASFAALANAAAGVWGKSLCTLEGTGETLMNNRSRLSQSAAFSPFLDVTGYGNVFKKFYMSNENASASNLIGVKLSGTRNVLDRIHILNPYDAATQGAEATATAIDISAEESYLKDCVFGSDAAARAAGSLLRLSGGTPRLIVDNCVFLMNASANAPFFIQGTAGLGLGYAIFRGCTFLNHGTSLTYGVDGTGLNNYKIFFDSNCVFSGVTDIVAAAQESKVIFGTVPASASTDDLFGLAVAYDHTP